MFDLYIVKNFDQKLYHNGIIYYAVLVYLIKEFIKT